MFYPDEKPHISPSAFATWHRQKSLFIRSYFKGEKTPETGAMKAGTRIHALVEGGMLDVAHRFNHFEETLTVELGNGVKVLGIPDSHETSDSPEVSFVDYKTGKEDTWTKEKLATDLKMKCTAFLVLKQNPQATGVRAIIEWIGTEWNGSELVPSGETNVVEHVFTAAELVDFEEVIKKTVDEVNIAYETFLTTPTQSLVEDEDVLMYAELEAKKKEIEAKQDEIKERIGEQLAIAGQDNFEHDLGTFYTTTRKTYEYPKGLLVRVGEHQYTLEQSEEIASATSAAKKDYELTAEPKTVSKSVGFRAKKAKK